jgi:hypothetical protein
MVLLLKIKIGSRIGIIDKEIVTSLFKKNVKFIQFVFTNVCGSINMVATHVIKKEYKNHMEIRFGKNRVYINTPYSLKKHIGSDVFLFLERIDPIENEVFRIEPVNFDFNCNIDCNFIVKKTESKPIFTNKNRLVVPRDFINKNVKSELGIICAKFDINQYFMNDGLMLVSLLPHIDIKGITYTFDIYKTGMITHQLDSVVDIMANGYNSNLLDFKFVDFDPTNNTILFKEDF